MMRAKLRVQSVVGGEGQQRVVMCAVTGVEPFGPNGESENNTFARWTPDASLSITITNPNLVGKFTEGQEFYVDFTEAPK